MKNELSICETGCGFLMMSVNLQILELSLDICLIINPKKYMYRICNKLLLIKFFLFALQEEETIEVKEVSTYIYMVTYDHNKCRKCYSSNKD